MSTTSSPRSTPPPAEVPSRPSLAGRQRARALRWAGWLLVLAPVIAVVAADFVTRGERIVDLPLKYVASYGVAVLESGALWATLVVASAARRGLFRWAAAALFVALFTLSMGGQLYFHAQYATYLNLDATLFGTSVPESLLGQLEADGAHFLQATLPPFLLSLGVVVAARWLPRPRRSRARFARFFAIPAVVAVFLLPCSYRRVQASTPDVIYFHAIGGLVKELSGERTVAQIRPGRRTPPALPPLAARPSRSRNVVLLLTESVRADTHCSVPADDCAIAPEANRAAPHRMPLTQLRSNSSTTAIQLAVLWSGLEPTAGREALHAAPVVFDYAHAAGLETAYWTSHHMMFANSRLWVQDLPTRFQCGATDIEPLADIDLGGDDALLVDRALAEIGELREPYLAVVHVGNTHVPYKIDPDDAPFAPWSPSKAEADNESYRNYYKNAIHLQDRSIGRFLRELRARPAGERAVVIFTSDHGEGFREHHQLGHTGSVYEEEIHVPGWIDAPPGTLTEDEERALASWRDAFAFHTDVAPTVLDLLGLWDAPELAPFRERMPGQSWLRAPGPRGPVALTNCSGVWGCAFRNWGYMVGTRKLEGREWDQKWHCFDVAADPLEEHDLGPDACAELVPIAERVHGGHPGGR